MFALRQRQWLLAVGVVTLGLAGTAQAATPYSRVKPLAPYTTSSVVKVEYEAQASEGAVERVDLYLSHDGGAFSLAGSSYDPFAPFYIDTPAYGGDGRYAFYTVATLASSEVESKTAEAEAYTTVDTKAPAAPDAAKLQLNQVPSLDANEVTGIDGAVEGGATVEMFADAGLTQLLRSSQATATGSFGPMLVGGTSVLEVWLTVKDAAGLRSAATKVTNVMSYHGALTNFRLKSDSGTTATISFIAPADARQFRVQYRHAGGAVWSVDYYTVGENGTTIYLTGLEPGRAYDVRVAPVDSLLNVGMWSFGSVRAQGTPIDAVILPGEMPARGGSTAGVAEPATTVATTVTPGETAAATPTPTVATEAPEGTVKPVPTPTPAPEVKPGETTPPAETPAETPAEEGSAPAANTEGESADAGDAAKEESGATPWVILAILIVLAGIATGGYFYWFSGPEEVTTTVTPPKETVTPEETTTTTTTEETKKPEDDADKRW